MSNEKNKKVEEVRFNESVNPHSQRKEAIDKKIDRKNEDKKNSEKST